MDTGVAYKHPDLVGNAWRNPGDPVNGADDDGDGFIDDVFGADFFSNDSNPDDDGGHGTHVAGIIGAQGNNALGVTGVNWDVNLMALKFLDENGEGNTADAANAIDYAVAHGARVVNASWGGPSFSQALYGSIKRAGERGTLVVAAAGNEGVNADVRPDYPAAFDLPNIVSVAATDRADRLLDFSNYGAKSVDLAAPGDDIYSTVPTAYRPERATPRSAAPRWRRPSSAARRPCTCRKLPAGERRPDQGRAPAERRPAADARGQDRQRRPPEHRRALGAAASPSTRPAQGHDASLGLLPDPPALPARDAQAGAGLQVAALARRQRHPACTAST